MTKELEIRNKDDLEDPDWDPRTLSMEEIRRKFGLADAVTVPEVPQLVVPDNCWFTSHHVFVQQTNMDDIWRLGISPIRFIGTRHVEWLEFDCKEDDTALYSSSLMYYAISDFKPIKHMGQALDDIQYCFQSPFHRVKVLNYNRRIADNPSVMIGQDRLDHKWLVTMRWVAKAEMFNMKPICDGRYGEWYDAEQYLEWLKNEGVYKDWQMDEVTREWEDGKMSWRQQTNAKANLHYSNRALVLAKQKRIHDGLGNKDEQPRYLELNESRKETANRGFKPGWWPW
jgi:hypothetical protein